MSKATYDDIAPHYDRAIRPLERWFLAGLRVKLISQLPPEASILEIGAGTGLNFRAYPSTARGAAIEPSGEMLRVAAGKQRPGHVQLVQSCAEALPFRNQSFDAAFATLVFCSVESPQDAFFELQRVVKPGGVILLLEHVRPNGLLGPIFDLLNFFSEPLSGDRFNRRTAAQAEVSGLQLENVERRYLGIINLIRCRVAV